MKEFVLCRTNEPDLVFDGHLLASVDSERSARARGNKRWTRLSVYATSSNKFVLQIEGVTEVPGEGTTSEVSVVERLADIVAHLRMTWLAKELLNQLGLRAVERI